MGVVASPARAVKLTGANTPPEAVDRAAGDGAGESGTTIGLDELEPRRANPIRHEGVGASPSGRQRHLPSIAPDPEPGRHRSRFDAETGTVLYNEQHADFLLVKSDETALLDYLATLVAKEYVVSNNPRAATDDLAEELVRMLIRVRRHLPARVRRR